MLFKIENPSGMLEYWKDVMLASGFPIFHSSIIPNKTMIIRGIDL